jgi:hypothetical protein
MLVSRPYISDGRMINECEADGRRGQKFRENPLE